MKYSRSLDTRNILITTLSGTITQKDAFRVVDDLPVYADGDEIYDLVIHADDTSFCLEPDEVVMLVNRVKEVLEAYTRGAIAFVSTDDLLFGICRQIQIQIENEFIQVCVFRTVQTAMNWLHEIKIGNQMVLDDR